MKKEDGMVSDRKPETVDKLLDRYLSDPGSLSLEDQREMYRYFLERMSQSVTRGPEAGMLEEAIAAVDRELEKTGPHRQTQKHRTVSGSTAGLPGAEGRERKA